MPEMEEELIPSQLTVATLVWCTSIHAKKGFKSIEAVEVFWDKYGPNGFLNIKEITPQMVSEIRRYIEKKRSST